MIISLSLQEIADKIADLPNGSQVLFLGLVDSGKTHLAQDLVRQIALSRGRSGYVDGDIGQSETAAPGIVAGSLIDAQSSEQPVKSWRAASLEFVGASTPAGKELEWVSAVCLCARECRQKGAAITFIDTPGWVNGRGAMRVFDTLFRLIAPEIVVCLSRPKAPNPLIEMLRRLDDSVMVIETIAALEARRKGSNVRAARRSSRIAAMFGEATRHEIGIESVDLIGFPFIAAPLFPAHMLKYISGVVHAQCLLGQYSAGDGVSVVIGAENIPRRPFQELEEHFGTRKIIFHSAAGLTWRLCGLRGADGRVICAGIIEGFDFARGRMSIIAPLRSIGHVAQIALGTLRAYPDGRELPPIP